MPFLKWSKAKNQNNGATARRHQRNQRNANRNVPKQQSEMPKMSADGDITIIYFASNSPQNVIITILRSLNQESLQVG